MKIAARSTLLRVNFFARDDPIRVKETCLLIIHLLWTILSCKINRVFKSFLLDSAVMLGYIEIYKDKGEKTCRIFLYSFHPREQNELCAG